MGLIRNLSRMVAPAVKAVASAKPPIGAPLSNQNMGFLGQAPQKIISAVTNSAPAQNVATKVGQPLSNQNMGNIAQTAQKVILPAMRGFKFKNGGSISTAKKNKSCSGW
jgi:hypothetical protein